MATLSAANENLKTDLPTPSEIELMADVLRAKLGEEAASVAMFFANEQKALGDQKRFEAWASVAEQIHLVDQKRKAVH